MQINVSSQTRNLRHTGLMNGMQIHDALLKGNYRGRAERVSINRSEAIVLRLNIYRLRARDGETRNSLPQVRHFLLILSFTGSRLRAYSCSSFVTFGLRQP